MTRFLLLSAALLCASAAAHAQATLPDAPGAQTQPEPAVAPQPTGPTVVLDTSMGRIICQLFDKEAPKASANFIALAEGTREATDPVTGAKSKKRYYDGTTFHRVIPGFMIQGGDPTATGTGDPGYYVDDEFAPGLDFDVPGRLAMANSGPNTNGSQFFITEAAYPSLSQHYTLFGQCDSSGVSVVASIARVERNSQDKPLIPVVLKKVTIVREGQPIPAKETAPAAAPDPAKADPAKPTPRNE